MAASNPQQIRNVTLVGHGGTGKTTLTEMFAHQAGLLSRIGTVEEGTTVSDFDDEEKTRGHSIDAAAIFFTADGAEINVLDTPGYPDFIGPALVSLGAVETAAVVVSASGGLEVNTRRLFEAAGARGWPGPGHQQDRGGERGPAGAADHHPGVVRQQLPAAHPAGQRRQGRGERAGGGGQG